MELKVNLEGLEDLVDERLIQTLKEQGRVDIAVLNSFDLGVSFYTSIIDAVGERFKFLVYVNRQVKFYVIKYRKFNVIFNSGDYETVKRYLDRVNITVDDRFKVLDVPANYNVLIFSVGNRVMAVLVYEG